MLTFLFGFILADSSERVADTPSEHPVAGALIAITTAIVAGFILLYGGAYLFIWAMTGSRP